MTDTLLKLIIGHFIADFPLQGDFLSKAKNHKQPILGVPWMTALLAHATIQAGMVWLVTRSLTLAGIELAVHAIVDWLKCGRHISFNQDQVLHLSCKVVYACI